MYILALSPQHCPGSGYSHCHCREVKGPHHLDLASQFPLLMQLSLVLDPAQHLAAID